MGISTFIVTDVGAALLAQAAIAGELTLTRAAVGKGFLTAARTETERTALLDSVCDMTVATPTVSGTALSVTAQFSNVNGTDGFYPGFSLAEIGLFARIGAGAETLLCYANAGDAAHADYIPGDSLREFAFTFVLAFTGADAVDIHVGSSIVYVARSEFTALLEPLQAEVNAKLPLTGGTLTGAILCFTLALHTRKVGLMEEAMSLIVQNYSPVHIPQRASRHKTIHLCGMGNAPEAIYAARI